MSQKKISDMFSAKSKASTSSTSNFASQESAPKIESDQIPEVKNEESVKILPEIGDKPHQPNSSFIFKKREFSAGYKRNFQHKWFTDYPWIHYSESDDKAYCFHCIKCIKNDLKGDKPFNK